MLLAHRRFLVVERVAIVKLTDTFDLFDPMTNDRIGTAIDEPPVWAKFARILVHKRFLPTKINIYENGSELPVFTIEKKPGFLRVVLNVLDARGHSFGALRSKLFRLGGGFTVHDSNGSLVAQVNGDWKGWNFKFVTESGKEVGTVSKKWSGLGMELFTSSDKYLIDLEGTASADPDPTRAALLLAAGLSIDTVFKEH